MTYYCSTTFAYVAIHLTTTNYCFPERACALSAARSLFCRMRQIDSRRRLAYRLKPGGRTFKIYIMIQQGNIGVTSENIFPVIKQFLYSDHEIFLREIVANAVDARHWPRPAN